jgi:hypothetical protein
VVQRNYRKSRSLSECCKKCVRQVARTDRREAELPRRSESVRCIDNCGSFGSLLELERRHVPEFATSANASIFNCQRDIVSNIHKRESAAVPASSWLANRAASLHCTSLLINGALNVAHTKRRRPQQLHMNVKCLRSCTLSPGNLLETKLKVQRYTFERTKLLERSK